MSADAACARWLVRLKNAYRDCFEGKDRKLKASATLVLGDLYNVCHQGRSIADPGFSRDDMLIAEGERRVYLRITNMLRATEADLYEAALAMAREQRAMMDPLETGDFQ